MISLGWDLSLHAKTKPLSQVGPGDLIVFKNGVMAQVRNVVVGNYRSVRLDYVNPDPVGDSRSHYNGIPENPLLQNIQNDVAFVIDANTPDLSRVSTFREFYDTFIAPRLPSEAR